MKSVIFLVLLVFLFGCMIHNHKNYPEKEFVFIEQSIKLDMCNLLIDKCEPKEGETIASGVIVAHKNKKTYILTAAHFCNNNSFMKQLELPGFIEGSISDNIIKATNSKGKQYVAKVVNYDNMYDLCLLETDYMDLPAIKLSRNSPKHAERVLNVAAPGGLWDVHNVLIFDGHYTGHDNEHKSTYILAAEPGSSGSPIVNTHGYLIGIITKVKQGGFTISFSPSLNEIKIFLQKSV